MNSWCIRIDNITSNIFIAPVDIKGRIGGFEGPFKKSASRESSILGSVFKSKLDNFWGEPSKERS